MLKDNTFLVNSAREMSFIAKETKKVAVFLCCQKNGHLFCCLGWIGLILRTQILISYLCSSGQ